MKHVGRQVLGVRADVHPPCHERIHALEVVVVKLREAGGIPLRRLDQETFIRSLLHSLQPILRSTRSLLGKLPASRKVTREFGPPGPRTTPSIPPPGFRRRSEPLPA